MKIDEQRYKAMMQRVADLALEAIGDGSDMGPDGEVCACEDPSCPSQASFNHGMELWRVVLSMLRAAGSPAIYHADDVAAGEQPAPTFAQEQEFKAWYENEFGPLPENDDKADDVAIIVLNTFRGIRSWEMSHDQI